MKFNNLPILILLGAQLVVGGAFAESRRLPAFELGQAAGRALLERIAGRAVPDRTLLPTELIVRASTAPRPGT